MQPLPDIRAGSDVFIDANIFIYGLNSASAQCRQLLERCSVEELTGISLFEIVNEATHKFMIAEAVKKGLIRNPGKALDLNQNPSIIPALIDYWHNTERILALNLLLLPTNETIIRIAQPERQNASLLTNDSMIVSCMREYGIHYLATADGAFARTSGITVFGPDDL